MAYAQFLCHVRTKVFDNDVPAAAELVENLPGLWSPKVQCDAFLASVVGPEIGTVPT